jgi:hypothetical protein
MLFLREALPTNHFRAAGILVPEVRAASTILDPGSISNTTLSRSGLSLVKARLIAQNKQLPWRVERMREFILRPLRFVLGPKVLYFLATSGSYNEQLTSTP